MTGDKKVEINRKVNENFLDIKGRCLNIVSEILAIPKEEIEDQTPFREKFDAYLWEIVDIVVEVEHFFAIVIENVEFEKINCLESLVSLVKEKLSKKNN